LDSAFAAWPVESRRFKLEVNVRMTALDLVRIRAMRRDVGYMVNVGSPAFVQARETARSSAP
jgi:hypothetical protein